MVDAKVFPRRNLGRAEYWGRVAEDRLTAAEKTLLRGNSSLSGLTRFDSSMQGDLSRQIEDLGIAFEQLQDALLLTPTAGSNASSTSGFSLSTGWNTVLSFNVPIAGGKTSLNVIANGRVTVKDDGPTGGGGGLFQWPFPLEYVTSEYGWRGEGSGRNFHSGIDFAGGPASSGSPIYAPANGTVISTGTDGSRGNYINLSHGAGIVTRYFHMNSSSPLSSGDTVTRAVTVLGYVGNTGASFGAHLHWETWIEGQPLNDEGYPAISPRDFMSVYGDDGSGPVTGEYSDIRCRIVINGNNSIDFEPYKIFNTDADPDFIQDFLYPVHGLNYTGSTAQVDLDVYSSADVPGDGFNTASLNAFGVFA